MPTKDAIAKIDALRAQLQDPEHDPELIHDDLRKLADRIVAQEGCIPADLREALDEAEADILDAFHDNLPI